MYESESNVPMQSRLIYYSIQWEEGGGGGGSFPPKFPNFPPNVVVSPNVACCIQCCIVQYTISYSNIQQHKTLEYCVSNVTQQVSYSTPLINCGYAVVIQ